MRAVSPKTLFLVIPFLVVAGVWAAAPDVSGVDPRQGPIDRATGVTVSGAGFDPAAKAMFLPGGFAFAGLCEQFESARDVVINDRYAYVADRSGLRIADISDPHAPTLAGGIPTGPSSALDVSGRHAFVADDSSRLHVVDVADPRDPRELGSVSIDVSALDLVVSGRFAYVVGDGGLRIIDVGVSSSPALIGSYAAPNRAVGVAVSGDYAYVADAYSGLWVVDVRDPAAPIFAARHDTEGRAEAVAVRDDYAYVAGGYGGLLVLDVSDPTTPSFVTGYMTYGQAIRVTLSGPHAYVATDTGLQVLDISDPAHPVFSLFREIPEAASAVAARWGRLYLALPDAGLQIVELSESPPHSHSCDTPGLAWDVKVAGGRAFVTDFAHGLQVIDVANPAAPWLGIGCDTPGEARGFALAGDLAFVADFSKGLQIVDFGDLQNPKLVGDCDSIGRAWDVAVVGDHAYVAVESLGIKVIDVSDPSEPFVAGFYDTPGHAVGLAAAGEHLYVADHIRGLSVLRITDPTSPVLVANLDTPGDAVDVALASGYAYVADRDQGLQVIDVSDPQWPTPVAGLELPGSALGVSVSGERAYVTGFGLGLQVVDVSDPTRPVAAERFADMVAARNVAVVDGHAFVTDGYTGLQVIRLNPALENVVVPSSETLEMTVPAGMVPGPYDVRVVNRDGSRFDRTNSYRACETRELAATWAEDVDSKSWALEIDADPSFLDPEARHRAVLTLPPLPQVLKITTSGLRPNEPTSIELVFDAESDTGLVRLAADDADGVERLWRGILGTGEIPLPRLDDRSYGRLQLERSQPTSNAGVGSRRVSYLFEFDDDSLSAVRVEGAPAELSFAVTGLDQYHCVTRTEVTFD